MNTITCPIQLYTEAFKVETYHYRLVDPVTGQVKLGNYNREQLIKAKGFFRYHNVQGFNIYCRPVGYQFVLLDDLNRDVLTDLAQLKPCMLMETSPGNYQAWLILQDVPQNRETAKAICKELAVRFGADLASAEPDHVGRLPDLYNRKEKYIEQYGKYPFIKLLKFEHRLSNFYPQGGAVLNTPTPSISASINHSHSPSNGSISEQDFGVACGLIRQGKSDSEIYQHLLSTSPDLAHRKGKHVDSYLNRTIRNAHRAIQNQSVYI
ncbi:DNA-primase RepB domain-containing protein [Spirosoma gilvum]